MDDSLRTKGVDSTTVKRVIYIKESSSEGNVYYLEKHFF